MATLSQKNLEDWIRNTTGSFHYTKAMDGQITPELYPQIRMMMFRAKEHGVAYPVNGRDGWWRPADVEVEEVFWWDFDGEFEEVVKLPLGINEYCHIPQPSLVIVTGVYNVGKTAFMINVVNENIELWKDNIFFYVSEGAEMMGKKIRTLNPMMPLPPPFVMYRRTENFADLIKQNPNALHVVDYVRVDMDKPYALGTRLFEIFNALGSKGIAVVALQKPPGRKLAFGGASTAFEPTLYLSMERGGLEFEKVKIPKTDKDWTMLKIEYKIGNGVRFYDVIESYG